MPGAAALFGRPMAFAPSRAMAAAPAPAGAPTSLDDEPQLIFDGKSLGNKSTRIIIHETDLVGGMVIGGTKITITFRRQGRGG